MPIFGDGLLLRSVNDFAVSLQNRWRSSAIPGRLFLEFVMNKKQWLVLPALVIATARARATGGGFALLRARLVDKLQLDASQQTKLDTILAESQPRFMALDKLEAQLRAPARAKLVGELQLKINSMLTPDQRATYELMQAQVDEQRQARTPATGAAPAAAKSVP